MTRAFGEPHPDTYWAGTQTVVILLIAVVAVRIHELFSPLAIIKPVFTLSVVGVVLLLTRSSEAARGVIVKHPLSRLVYLYYGAILLTIPFALWTGMALDVAKAMIPPLLLVTGFMLCPARRATLDRLQIWFVLLLLFFTLYVRAISTAFGGRLRSVGLYGDPNDLAAVLAAALPLSLGLVMRTRRPRDRAAAAVAAAAIVLTIVATGSRGGTLALLAGALVFASGMKGERGFLIVLAMMAGGIAAWFTAPESFRTRITSLTNLEDDYNYTSESGRKAVWKRGRAIIRQYPIVGAGAGNFGTADGAYKQETGGTGKWSAPHNAYLQAFAELGAIGGSIFVLMLLTAARLALPLWRPPKRGRAPPVLYRPEFLASLAAFASAAYFLSHAYFMPLFGTLGFIALADRVSRAEGVLADTGPAADQHRTFKVPGQRGRLAWGTARVTPHTPILPPAHHARFDRGTR